MHGENLKLMYKDLHVKCPLFLSDVHET